MQNLSLTLSLFAAGLVVGLFLSLGVASTISGICNAIAPGSSKRKVGLIMVMIYLPVFLFLMRHMTEVMPMIIGIGLSSSVISIAVLIKNIRATKNPLPLPKAG